MAMTQTLNYVFAHSWDPPQITQHYARFYKQTPTALPWVKTLCGRSLLSNGEHRNAEMCEECEEEFDDDDEIDDE
jgi:hypothetical protein